MKPVIRSIVLAAALTFLQISACVAPNRGGGSETGNPTGIVFSSDGSRAAGATVVFISSGYEPRGGSGTIDSTTTNDTGGYSFSALPANTYNIACHGNGNLAYRDSVKVASNADQTVPACTLKTAGTLSGTVHLAGTDNPENALILFLGTQCWTTPTDTFGHFTSQPLAEGTYRVRFTTTGVTGYTLFDTTLTVTSGKNDTLQNPIELRYNGIPVPTGLHIKYDTMKQIVTLIWNKPASGGKVSGYTIYRCCVDSNKTPTALTSQLITDTTYSDSTGVQGLTYKYQVAARDTNGNAGSKCGGVQVKVVGAFELVDSILTQGSGQARVDADNRGNIYVAEGTAINLYDRITKTISATWKLPTTFGKIHQIKFKNDTTLVIATSGKIAEYSLKDSTIANLCIDSTVLIMAVDGDTIFYIQGLFPDPNNSIRKISKGMNSATTILTVSNNLPSGVTAIEGIAVANKTVVFGVDVNPPGTTDYYLDIYQAAYYGKILTKIATLPSYTNQGAAFCIKNDTVYMTTHEPNSDAILTHFRMYSLNGKLISDWQNQNSQCEIIKVIDNRVYASVLGKILIYQR